jgi:UDP-N-acetylmuramoyl-L-alanyl-D-glutamate--2,6-diaminopimelate ligase
MGRAVGERADVAVLTSDNPRTEDPAAIAEPVEAGLVAAGARGYVVELDRRKAIALAIASAAPGDVLVIAGKGHEDYQIIGTQKHRFDDRVEARAALARRRGR